MYALSRQLTSTCAVLKCLPVATAQFTSEHQRPTEDSWCHFAACNNVIRTPCCKTSNIAIRTTTCCQQQHPTDTAFLRATTPDMHHFAVANEARRTRLYCQQLRQTASGITTPAILKCTISKLFMHERGPNCAEHGDDSLNTPHARDAMYNLSHLVVAG